MAQAIALPRGQAQAATTGCHGAVGGPRLGATSFAFPLPAGARASLGYGQRNSLTPLNGQDQADATKRAIGSPYRHPTPPLDKRAKGGNRASDGATRGRLSSPRGGHFAFTKEPDRRAFPLPPRDSCQRPRALPSAC